jgi:DNA helicase II / ATP-dependent DNA helicase PcrA
MSDIPQKIILSKASKICAVAAPGAGKTSAILLPKIKQILENKGVNPDNVLLLTFSRMSAKDLREKVSFLDRKPMANTVHSYCLSFLLSENNHAIRKRVDNILLDFEKDVLLSDLKIVFPKINKRELKKLLNEFSAGWATKQQDDIFDENEQRKKFKMAVINWLIEHEAVMMEEIIYHAVNLAKKISGSKFIERPKYIFVDEFQDLNKLEQEFVNILAENSNLLLVVGDPDQSIYSFKFAHRDGIREFGNKKDVDFYEWGVSRRCPKKVIAIANQILQQAEPERTNLLQTSLDAVEGNVRFVVKNFQIDEFKCVVDDIAGKIKSGSKPNSFLVLAPKKKLGQEFAEYANSQRSKSGIPSQFNFSFTSKFEFPPEIQKRIMFLSLIVNPRSILHMRTCLGFDDQSHYAKEFVAIKKKYGSLNDVFAKANPSDFPLRNSRIRELCERMIRLKEYLKSYEEITSVDKILSSLFPSKNKEYAGIREIFSSLREDDDDINSLYIKFLDFMNTIPSDENTIRAMTIMASKGLDADHIYIIGCNGGNIPGENRSEHLSDLDYRNEQLRLLFVGVTRAKKTLMISWSRYILFRQSRGQHTQSISTRKFNGNTYSVVSLSEFLQNLDNIVWET